jgi:hypothetical protein
MALKNYALTEDVTLFTDNHDSVQIKQGTFVAPIWNTKYLTKHLQEKMERLPNHVMCMVGTKFFPIEKRLVVAK